MKCERQAELRDEEDKSFYVVGVDLARSGVNTAIVVVRVTPTPAGSFKKKVVNIIVFNNMSTLLQVV